MSHEMDDAIKRYEEAKEKGTLDEEFPLIAKVYKDPIAFQKLPHTHGEHGSHIRVSRRMPDSALEPIIVGGTFYPELTEVESLQFICLDDGVIYKELEITREGK